MSCLLVLLIFQINTGQVYSQMQPTLPSTPSLGSNSQPIQPGTQIPSPQLAKNFQGTYANSEFGVELTLPEGMPGMEMQSQGVTELTIPALLGAGEIKIFLSNSPEASNLTASSLHLQTDPSDCKLGSNTVTIGGKVGRTSNDPCNLIGVFPSKLKHYHVDLGSSKTFDLYFIAPTSVYDISLPAFEELVKTVKFTK